MNLKNFPKRLDSKISCLRITVPENLDLALEGLIRKVLKEQPKTDDIYSFAANYFETLLNIRDKAGAKFTSAQLCPFHNDEDAHVMIKLAGTFSRPSAEKVTKKESLPSKTKNVPRKKEFRRKDQHKKNVRNSQSEKTSDNEKSVDENERKMSKVIEKLPVTEAGITEQEKEQTELTNEISDDNALEKKTKKEDSDDEDFLASDPIKEFVEKELMMEAKSKGKRKEMKKNIITGVLPEEIIKNKNNQKEQKPAENVSLEPGINDANKELEKQGENKSRNKEIDETKDIIEKEIKIESSGVTEQASEKSIADLQEATRGNIVNENEESNEKSEDVEAENEESAKNEKSNKEKTESIKDIRQENTDAEEDKTTTVEIKNRTSDNKEGIKIASDKTSGFNVSKITGEIRSEKEINRQSPIRGDKDKIEEAPPSEMLKAKDKSSEILNDKTEENKDKDICSEVLDKNNTVDINRHVEEQESLNNQQPARIQDQINGEEGIRPVENAAKDENSQTTYENKTKGAEVSSAVEIKPPVKESKEKQEAGKGEINNDQEPKTQKVKINGDTVTVTEETDTGSPKNDETPKEVLRKAEELNFTDNSVQSEKESKVTEEIAEVNKTKAANQDVKENDAEILLHKIATEGTKINETKSILEQLTGADENTAEAKRASETEKGKPSESPFPDKKFYQSEDKTSEEKEKLPNENQVRINEDKLFGEKTQDLVQSTNNESFQTKNTQAHEIVTTLQAQEREMIETNKDEQNVNQNTVESNLTKKELSRQEKERTEQQKQSGEVSTSLDSANKPDHGQSNEALKPVAPDTGEAQRKDDKNESEKELFKIKEIQEIPKREELENQKPDFETEELCTVIDTREISKESTSSEKSTSKPKFKTEISESREGSPKPKEVVNIQQVPRKNEIDSNEAEEKCKPENESTQNNQDKQTTEKKSPCIVTVEVEKAKEDQNLFQPPGERQIKTIQSHYYDTLQVPEIVFKEYRIHNVSPSAISPLVSVESSLQRSFEPKPEFLNKEERTEKIVDGNLNAPPVIESTNGLLPSQSAAQTEDLKIDIYHPVGHLKNDTSSPTNASSQNKTESIEQKSDSDDLLDLMTPTSDFSLNLSELSWQTISGLFLDAEKRHSSLEKVEMVHATLIANGTAGESGEQKTPESKQEVEEIIRKTVILSNIGAVPMPPRDAEEINEETNTSATENDREKKENDKPEDKSPENSSDSSNGQISVSDDTPFISVEVKTVIETQVLETDDDEDDHVNRKDQNGEERVRSGVEITVETTVDIGDEEGMTQPKSEPKENKTETTNGSISEKNGSKFSIETEDKNRLDKRKENSSTEQRTGKEGSLGESDSTASSAATEIKRTDFAKRNFSSTRNLLSTQSLDLGKKNPLLKTRSLSTFRHGVTDFEVWNAIEKELEEAATKIQSKFRGYKIRKKLQRENAVQITTEESSISTTPVEAEIKDGCGQSTGELHDSIVLSEHPR